MFDRQYSSHFEDPFTMAKLQEGQFAITAFTSEDFTLRRPGNQGPANEVRSEVMESGVQTLCVNTLRVLLDADPDAPKHAFTLTLLHSTAPRKRSSIPSRRNTTPAISRNRQRSKRGRAAWEHTRALSLYGKQRDELSRRQTISTTRNRREEPASIHACRTTPPTITANKAGSRNTMPSFFSSKPSHDPPPSPPPTVQEQPASVTPGVQSATPPAQKSPRHTVPLPSASSVPFFAFNFKSPLKSKPKLQVSIPPSTDTVIPPRRPEYGIWSCCECKAQNHLLIQAGPHPIGTVACKCPHKPCEECKFSGSLKHFLPITEPCVVPDPVSSSGAESQSQTQTDMEVLYGVVCKNCGLSWRAKDLELKSKKKEQAQGNKRALKRMPSLRDALRDLHHHPRRTANRLALAPRGGRLQKSQSLMNFYSAPAPPVYQKPCSTSSSEDLDKDKDKDKKKEKEKEKDEEEQGAPFTTVKFSGLRCTCGCLLVSDAEPSRYTDAELQAKGHHDKTVKIRHVMHPNPLRSNPPFEAEGEAKANAEDDGGMF